MGDIKAINISRWIISRTYNIHSSQSQSNWRQTSLMWWKYFWLPRTTFLIKKSTQILMMINNVGFALKWINHRMVWLTNIVAYFDMKIDYVRNINLLHLISNLVSTQKDNFYKTLEEGEFFSILGNSLNRLLI